MELSATSLQLLQDEACASLCREAVLEKLASRENPEAPPGGEAALRDRLALIAGIEERLRPVLRKHVADHLAGTSPDFGRCLQIRARLADWEQAFQAVPELLVALTLDLRLARQAAAAREFVHELAVLHDSAERLEQQHHELLVIAGAVAELLAARPAGGIGAPELPDFHRVAWVSRLAEIPLEQAVAEVARVECEIRAFLADGSAPALAQLAASRDACLQLEAELVESHWARLRQEAHLHGLEERDVGTMLETLAQRYPSTDLARRQPAPASDPLLVAP